MLLRDVVLFFFFQAEDGIRYLTVTGVQTCAFFFSSRRRHTRFDCDWSSDVCSSDLDVLFRISSLEPMDCSLAIVDLVATSDRFAPHFHLPLQHASDRVLSAMRRPYKIGRASCRERV